MQMKQFDSRHDIRLVIPPEYRLWEEAEVHFLMEDASRNLLVNDKADYVNKKTGEVVYRLREVDTMKPGCHKAVFRIDYGDGTTMSFPQKGYIEVKVERTIHNGRDTHIVEEIALKVSLIDQKFADLSAEVEEWRENVADDVKEKVYDDLDIDRISNIEVIEARGGKKDLNERITGIDEGLNAHIADKKNPHGTTKNDVGLGNVPNWGAATQAEAQAGTNNSKIMTPHRTKEAITALATSDLVNNIGTKNLADGIATYPYGVSLARVASGAPGSANNGVVLTLRHNFTATAGHQIFYPTDPVHFGQHFSRYVSASMSNWSDWIRYETTEGAQDKSDRALSESIRRINQTGWGLERANDGPGLINDLDALNKSGQYWFTGAAIGSPWSGSAGGTLIHLVSGNMSTFANQLAFTDSNNQMFFRRKTSGTWAAWQQLETTSGAQEKVNAHANDKENPHGTNKTQVGLGNVDNVKQASKAEFDAYVAKRDNPHNVTKSQVGLGNVQNYPVASQAQAEAGTHTGSFMTPQRTKQAFNAFSNEPLNWIRASLQSTWSHSGSWPVRYAKDSTGTVYIEGSMNGGAIGGDPAIVQFTLPPGYRPGQTSYFWLVGSSSGTTGAQGLRCYLGANGNFIIQDMTWPGATQFVAVNIVFKAGN
ncbi:pyocin knob domain-containing protein [Shouchella clausii]|uniref:pyocin knob domain-containing protein n=1 Tax=Shouchella clausii TaxID=79880 RepID=UPI0015961D51|nr:pyocin knob domain-containing protein [Shouchella clausii]